MVAVVLAERGSRYRSFFFTNYMDITDERQRDGVNELHSARLSPSVILLRIRHVTASILKLVSLMNTCCLKKKPGTVFLYLCEVNSKYWLP